MSRHDYQEDIFLPLKPVVSEKIIKVLIGTMNKVESCLDMTNTYKETLLSNKTTKGEVAMLDKIDGLFGK